MKLPAKLMIGLFLVSIVAMIILSSTSPYKTIEQEHYIAPSDGRIKTNTRLYYVYDDALYSEVHRIVISDGEYESAVIDELKKGASNRDFKTLFDEGIDVSYVDTINNICYVNLSGEQVDSLLNRESKANLFLWSVVNSLTEIKGVLKVQFIYNDLPLNYISMGMNFSSPVPKLDSFNFKSASSISEIATDFIENLSKGRFDIAYNLLTSTTQKNISYVAFVQYSKKLLEQIEGYKYTNHFVKIYPNYRLVCLKYEKYRSDVDTFVRQYIYFMIKREDEQYKIDIKYSNVPDDYLAL